jgi:hypothetical protein
MQSTHTFDTRNMEGNRFAPGGHQLEVWGGNAGFGPKGGVLDGISVLGIICM